VFGSTVIAGPLPDEPNDTGVCGVSLVDWSGVVSHTLAVVAAKAGGAWLTAWAIPEATRAAAAQPASSR